MKNDENQKSDREAGRKSHAAGPASARNGDTFKKLRLMVLCHEDLVPPDSIDGLSAKEVAPYKTEWDVISTLKKIGHEVYPVGVYNNLGVIGNALNLLSINSNLQQVLVGAIIVVAVMAQHGRR